MSVTRVEKPWGYELHWAKTERYVGKVLHIKAGHALSLQYHNRKDETIYLHTGRMQFEIGPQGGPIEQRELLAAKLPGPPQVTYTDQMSIFLGGKEVDQPARRGAALCSRRRARL